MEPTLSVVMPFYNEAPTLRLALERLLKADLEWPLEAILVDDGSLDDGLDTIADLIDDERIVVLRNARRRGKGRAVRAGIEAASGRFLGVLDADLEYDPRDLCAVTDAVLNHEATVAFGTRALVPGSTASFWFALGNRLTSLWASLLFNTRLTDIHTCLKVAPLEVWRSLELTSDGFAIDPEATAAFLRAGHRIHEVPISYRARGRAEGKKLRWTDGVTTLVALTRVRFSRAPRGPTSLSGDEGI